MERLLFGLAVGLAFAAAPRAGWASPGDADVFARAQQRLARGECKAALQDLAGLIRAAPRSAEAPKARYLMGLCLIREERFAEAERLFTELVTSYPALRDDHLFLRGQALYLWGSKLDAARVLADVDPRGPRAEEARRLRARALAEASDFRALGRWLEELQGREGRLEPELLALLGEARDHLQDPRGAYQALREAWREEPTASFATRALAIIARLYVVGRPVLDDFERTALRALLADLARGRGHAVSLAELERRLQGHRSSSGLRAEVAYARGRVAASQRRLREAAEHYARAGSSAPHELAELRARAGLEEARVAERYAEDKRALQLFAAVADRFPDQPEAEIALLALGEIHLARREYDAAGGRFEALLLRSPLSPHRPRCLWGLGWIQYRLGRYEGAQRFFASLARLELGAEQAAAAEYWLARSEAQLDRFDAARRRFRDVLDRYPLSVYAALAENQLAEALPSSAIEGPRAPTPVQKEAAPALVQVEEYLRLGLRARADQALRDAERSLRKARRGRLAESVLKSLARQYDRLGATTDARRIREEYAREYPHALSSDELVADARRANPIRFEEEIRAAASEFGISEALVFALVRTESGFKADAVSPASAMGLAQLIMPTAAEVARRIGIRPPSARVLLANPKLNVRLGSAYLRQLLDRYDGSEPLALAAYNAGPAAVDAWLARRVRPLAGVGAVGKGVGLMPAADELMEEIPVAETRVYVKIVLARARSYARLISVPAVVPPPALPELDEATAAGVAVEPSEPPRPPRLIAEPPPGARFVKTQPDVAVAPLPELAVTP